MKRALALICALVILVLVFAGCEREEDTDKEQTQKTTVEETTVSEIEKKLEIAKEHLSKEEYEEAIAVTDEVISLDSSILEAYVLRGDAYYGLAQQEDKNKNLKSAIKDYEKAVEEGVSVKDTKLYDCNLSLAKRCLDDDNPNDARKYYQKAYEIDKSDPYVSLVQKLWMYKENDTANRISYFSFDYDGTGIAFYSNVVADKHTLEYTLDGDSLFMRRYLNIEYNWEYNKDKAIFEQNYGTLEVVPAKEAFTDWYNNIDENLSEPSDAYTQLEMTQEAATKYKTWDIMINVVYEYVVDVIPKDERESFVSDQIDWIVEKEAAMESEASKYSGGSLEPMVKNQVGADYTKERTKYLIDLIPAP